MPKVSVVVPAFNCERYIEQCLDSICAQELDDIEVVVVDDGSTDSTGEILQSYATRDARVKVCAQLNAGAGAARNLGLECCRGDYVAFLDADDFFEPGLLLREYERAIEAEADIVVCKSLSFDDITQETAPLDGALRGVDLAAVDSYATIGDKLFQFCIGWPWDKLFRREFVVEQGLRFQELRTTNDAFFVFIALSRAERIAYVDEALVFHRVGNAGSLENTRDRSWQNSFAAIDAIEAQLKEDGNYPLFERSYVNWVANYLSWHFSTLSPMTQEAMMQKTGAVMERCATVDDPSYFYSEDDYAWVKVLSSSRSELAKMAFETYKDNKRLRQECRAFEGEVARLEHEVAIRDSEISGLRASNEELLNRLQEVLASTTFKVGKALMLVPCAIKEQLTRKGHAQR